MNISKISNCYGCMACVNICPQKCIDIKHDKLGFLYPSVKSNCTNCGKCLRTCPANSPIPLNSPIETWAVWKKDKIELSKSSSGGAASAISESFIKQKGIVYGCAFIPPFNIKHIRCDSIQGTAILKGSKYVQSDIYDTYHLIKEDLKLNKKVLFIGTPCQVAGIKKYFHSNNSNLYTIDLICHGAPSIKLLKESIPTSILNGNIDNISFRKNIQYHFSIKSNNKIIYERPLYNDLYLKGFFTSLFCRSSCYNCQFATSKRIGDITLGDFWGYNIKETNHDLSLGTSLCFTNTEKGQLLLNKTDDICKRKGNIHNAINGNKPLNSPAKYNIKSKIFHKLYSIVGFKTSVICSIPAIILKNKIMKK